jgi:hypothetical protein
MEEIYNCDTCEYEDCHDCGRHSFDDGRLVGRQEFFDFLEPHKDIGYADNLITITLDKRVFEVQMRIWGLL